MTPPLSDTSVRYAFNKERGWSCAATCGNTPLPTRGFSWIHEVVHKWLLVEACRGVYICFTVFHAIAVETDAKKIYDPCFPTPRPLSDICTCPLTVKCWRLSCA